MKRNGKDVHQTGPAGKAVLAVIGAVQVAFAALAFWELSHRADEELRGSKPAWIPVILVNWIGPAAYFAFGVRRTTR